MAANEMGAPKPGTNGGLRFKEGPYLTPKVERIMLQIARGHSVSWIAQLYDVREPFVYYVARKTGFPSSALSHHGGNGNGAELEEHHEDLADPPAAPPPRPPAEDDDPEGAW